MEVKVKAIAGFKASVEAVGASTTIKAIVSVENDKYANIENGSVSSNEGNETDEDKIISVVTDVTHFVKYCKANAAKLGTISAAEAKEK